MRTKYTSEIRRMKSIRAMSQRSSNTDVEVSKSIILKFGVFLLVDLMVDVVFGSCCF